MCPYDTMLKERRRGNDRFTVVGHVGKACHWDGGIETGQGKKSKKKKKICVLGLEGHFGYSKGPSDRIGENLKVHRKGEKFSPRWPHTHRVKRE